MDVISTPYICGDIPSSYYTCSFFGHPVFYVLGPLVKNWAVQFSIYLAVWIRPTVPVRNDKSNMCPILDFIIYANPVNQVPCNLR